VWRLPAATPQSPGKALVNLLPLSEGETITSILPLPEDQKTWGDLQLMFATRSGYVRRNSLADFESINRNGKIAMKLDEGDRIVRVAICHAAAGEGEAPEVEVVEGEAVATGQVLDNVLLTTASGRCIRFPVDHVRLFKGRDSSGVRGIRLEGKDEVISMAILRHVEATPGERAAYLKQASAMRRAQGAEVVEGAPEPEIEEGAESVDLSPERYAELGGREQFVLTVSERGFGKRSSSYEYRISGRGGKGITAMIVNDRNGPLVASFPIEESDQIMLVTDGGKLIRCPVDDVRIAGRNTQGVRIFRTDDGEKVVSVERIPEDSADANGEAGTAPDAEGDPGPA
jgi:DNA gyrase subunit A